MHSEHHTLLYGTSPLNRQKLDGKKLLGRCRLLGEGSRRCLCPREGWAGRSLSLLSPHGRALPGRSHQPEDVCGAALRGHRGEQGGLAGWAGSWVGSFLSPGVPNPLGCQRSP